MLEKPTKNRAKRALQKRGDTPPTRWGPSHHTHYTALPVPHCSHCRTGRQVPLTWSITSSNAACCLLPAASSVVATLTNHIENVLQSLRVQFDLSDSHTHMQADTPDTPLATEPASGLANMGHKCGR